MANHIWLADERDLDEVTALIAAFRDWWRKDVPADESIRTTVRNLLGDPMTEYLLAAPAPGEAACGVCQLRYRLSVWTGAEDCWLEDLYVAGHARRSGIGRSLVVAALESARARGCRRVELDVNEENTAALEFYRALGFSTEPKPPGRTLFVARRLDP
jgi:ribosomal protein S18 acetylase RimI-like enzyme